MIPYDAPILLDDETERRTATGFMPPRDQTGLVEQPEE